MTEGQDPLENWKNRARADFEQWLSTVQVPQPDLPLATTGPDTPPAPDLHTLFAELAALQNETRKGNRRSAEIFGTVGESLSRCESILATTRSGPDLPRDHCLSLVDLLDRINRVAEALAAPPQPAPRRRLFGRPPDDPWPPAWESIRQGVGILQGHLRNLLQRSGITPVPARGLPFDPLTMVAVEAVPGSPPNHVVEEVLPGYQLAGQTLRPVEVKVTSPA